MKTKNFLGSFAIQMWKHIVSNALYTYILCSSLKLLFQFVYAYIYIYRQAYIFGLTWTWTYFWYIYIEILRSLLNFLVRFLVTLFRPSAQVEGLSAEAAGDLSRMFINIDKALGGLSISQTI